MQVMSQAQDSEQSKVAQQLRSLEQSTAHAPSPQVIAPVQLRTPSQRIVHSLASPQLMPPVHERSPRQSTTQGMPAGQTIVPGHDCSSAQVTVHTPSSHEVHGAGQSAASPPLSSMHQPPTQLRPPVQSAGPSQRKPSLRLSI